MEQIVATTCSSFLACAIVLPGTSTSGYTASFSLTNGMGMDLTSISTWAAATCPTTNVEVTVAPPTNAKQAVLTGDNSPASLFNVQGAPLFSLVIQNVVITRFGDGSSSFLGAVVANGIQRLWLSNVQVGPRNVGYFTGAVTVTDTVSAGFTASRFVSNVVVGVGSVEATEAAAAAVYVALSSTATVRMSVVFTDCYLANNTLTGGANYGGAVAVSGANTFVVTGTTWVKYVVNFNRFRPLVVAR